MTIDVLVLNSGEWALAEELPAAPWHILIYRQRGEPRNELHLWLPRSDARRTAELAFRRYWVDDETRWCVEAPGDPDRPRLPARDADGSLPLRFTAADGRVLWAQHQGAGGLGDLTAYQLGRMLDTSTAGPFARR